MNESTTSTTSSKSKKRSGSWSETCVGVWSKSTIVSSKNDKKNLPTTVCNGINIVRIKNLNVNTIQPTSTVGIQVIIHDTAPVDQKSKIPTSSELSITEQVLDTWNFGDSLKTVSDNTKTISDAMRKYVQSSDKLKQFNTFITKEYKDLQKWLNEYWK